MDKKTGRTEGAECREPGRRRFLRGVIAATALGAACVVIHRTRVLPAPVEEQPAFHAVGPMVQEGLTAERYGNEVRIMSMGEHVMTTNPLGWELITQADGSRTLDELILLNGLSEQAEAVADLFLTMGQTGWLQNRLEVRKYVIEA